MGLTQTAISHFKQGLPFLKPLWPLIVAFGITGVLIYKLPISGTPKYIPQPPLPPLPPNPKE